MPDTKAQNPQESSTTDPGREPGGQQEGAQESAPASTGPEPDREPAGDDLERTDDVAALRSEAKKRRLQLREAEAERDRALARLDDHDRREVERIAAGELTDPADLWIVAELDELRDDDGALDRENVDAALKDALERKPHWRKPAEPGPDLHQGARRSVSEPPSFGAALKGARRRR